MNSVDRAAPAGRMWAVARDLRWTELYQFHSNKTHTAIPSLQARSHPWLCPALPCPEPAEEPGLVGNHMARQNLAWKAELNSNPDAQQYLGA